MNPNKDKNTRDIVAIDVSKEKLQVHSSPELFETTNDKAGHKRIVKLASTLPKALVVCEPSGGYERPLLEALRQAAVPFALADAKQARYFALSQGQKAKSDPIDAKMLHAFAMQRDMQPDISPDRACAAVAELLDRRSQLSDDASSEKNRLDKCGKALLGSVRRHIAYLEKEIQRIETLVVEAVAEDRRHQAVFAALREVKGVGKVTAWAIIGYLPEIGRINRGRLSSLAGLAPFTRESGKWKGKRCIGGGRCKVRDPLYMAAVSGKQHNETLKSFYDRLKASGKPFKLCITAVMRKLLIHLQSVVKKVELELA